MHKDFTIGRVNDTAIMLKLMREQAEKATDPLVKATLNDRHELFKDLSEGTVPETDFPIADLKLHADILAGLLPRGNARQNKFNSGCQIWLTVALDKKRTVPVRVMLPKEISQDKPVPVVFALHGAGGSENMFFDTYGAGQIVKECEKRGWILVATRSGLNFTSSPPVLEVMAELKKQFPIDDKKVFLVGHSMGAGQVGDILQSKPEAFAGAAMLGGAPRVRSTEPFSKLPVYLGVGSKDFARRSVLQVKGTLENANIKTMTFKEYEDVEHLVIVREALPDVFKMFDVANKK